MPQETSTETSSPAGQRSASRRCRRAFAQALRLADQLVALAREPEAFLHARAETVSGWSVLQHLDHLAVANRSCTTAIARILAEPEPARAPRLTLIGRAVLLTRWIPRGAGKAPEISLPRGISSAALRDDLEEARRALLGLQGQLAQIQASRARVAHPILGGLMPLQWLRFIEIHTRHHLKIIGDIRRAAPPGLQSASAGGEVRNGSA